MATTLINRTISSTGSRQIGTFSCWCKKAGFGGTLGLFANLKDGSNRFLISFETDETLKIGNRVGGSYDLTYITTRVFRDPAAWMHIVVTIDTTAGSGDRVKLWVNGVRETVWGTSTEPGEDDLMQMNLASGSDYKAYVGGANHFDGIISHAHWIDGTAYQASDFGEVDSTSGIWKIKTSPSVTYGTNGFFILKDSNSLTDQSGEGNNFTLESGTLTATYDNPSNNFCTMNSLDAQSSNGAGINYANGNTHVTDGDSNWRSSWGTLGESVGKYYYEAKVLATSTNWGVGICDVDQVVKGETKFWATSDGYGTNASTQKCNSGAEDAWGGISIAQNDIVQCALDLDNAKIYFGKNGTWIDSGDPTSGATGTGAAFTINTGGRIYLPAWAGYGTAAIMAFNFGNGYFATTAISSEGTNASGIGSFEYDVPTGYTAWTTKGFNV